MSLDYDYDLIVIGSGPAGFSCAIQASKFNKRILVVEASADHHGGTWINTGTVPSKALREAASIIYKYYKHLAKEDVKPFDRFRMEDLLQYKQSTLETKNRKVRQDLEKNEIDTVYGFGTLESAHSVKVTPREGPTKTYSTEFILVSTGSSPTPPADSLGPDTDILNYESILRLTHIPRRLVILGGSVNAVEYATIFACLGTRVTILNDQEDLLFYLDHEVKEHLFKAFRKRGITVYHSVDVEDIRENALRNYTEVSFRDDITGRMQVVETEHVLHFGKYKPNTDRLNLAEVGITLDEGGYIEVDSSYKTGIPSVYAAGDIIGLPTLASVSFLQGRLAACDMFGISELEMSRDIPFGIYSIPEMAGIGLTENDAREMGLEYTVGRAFYSNVTQADIGHEEEGLLKLVFHTRSLKLLGVHIIGEGAADLIHLGQSIMARGEDIRYFISHVVNYPSYTEAYRIAAFNGFNRVHKAGVKYRHILENGKTEKQS